MVSCNNLNGTKAQFSGRKQMNTNDTKIQADPEKKMLINVPHIIVKTG